MMRSLISTIATIAIGGIAGYRLASDPVIRAPSVKGAELGTVSALPAANKASLPPEFETIAGVTC